MKKTLSFLLFLSFGYFGYAQSLEESATQHEETVEPSHGEKMSELAKDTPGNREKGGIIRSAAREKALLHANAKADLANRNGKPANAGKAGSVGKPSAIPPTVTPPRGKPLVAGRPF